MAGCRANLDLEAEKLNCEIAELENSVKHLRRSNEELTAALEGAPEDEDFAAALRENEEVIGKREALLEELRKELRGLHASLVQAVNGNLAALDLQQPLPPVAVPVAVPEAAARERAPPAGGTSGGPQLGLGDGLEEKAEGVYL